MSQLKATDAVANGPSKSPFSVSKQLGLDQVSWNRRAIDRHKTAAPTVGLIV